MKNIIVLLSFLTFFAISCGDDATSPSSNPLTGKWKEYQINGNDTLSIIMTFKTGSNISGTSDIMLFRQVIEGNVTKEERLEYNASVTGTLKGDDVEIKVLFDDSDFFKGKLSADKKSITGVISLFSPMLDKIVDFNITLTKQ